MEFRLLGPLEVRGDHGQALELGGQKRRALLALLLLHANEVVSSDRLIEELWGQEPPQAATTALHGHVSRLRKLLGGDGQLLVTRAPGYVLELEPEQLDLHRFERLREDARAARSEGDITAASAKLRDALALWRGPALADLVYERLAQLEAERLEDLRLATVEERVDVDLELGRHPDLVPELERLVAEHPLREGFRAQLMLALYRSGRQAEALQAYQDARHVLLEELGIAPSQRLRDLEQAILRQDDSLAPPGIAASMLGDERAGKPPLRRSRRRTFISIVGLCAIGGAVAAGLLLSNVGGGKAAAAYRPGTVLLDAKSRKQTAFLSTSKLAQPAAPVYAHGHIWLLNLTPASFVELDPATGRELTPPFKTPDGVGDARAVRPFAVGRDALWVAAGDDLVKIDARLGEELERFHLDKLTKKKGQAQGVALGGGLVWVGRDVGLGQVVAFNPRTDSVRRFNVPHHADLAFDDGIVWAADSGGVNVIDLATGHVANVDDLESMDPFFGPNSTGNGVAAGGGFGWTTDPAKGLVYKIDRTGRIVAQYTTGLGATGVSYSDGAVWVRNEDVGSVTRIDPVTGDKTSFGFGHSVAAEVAGGGVLLAALEPGPTIEDRFKALPRNSLRLFSKQGALGLGNGEPSFQWDKAAEQIEFATCAKLLRQPDESGAGGLRLLPEVAAGMPAVSGDRRTYTFRIRPGYRFSPPVGQALTAQTFRYSLERAASPKVAPDPTAVPGPGIVEDVEGYGAFRSGKASHISGLRVAAHDRLSITLSKPSADFLTQLGLASCPVPLGTPFVPGGGNPQRAPDPNDRTIPSAGPYYVADWRNNKYVILKRNPNYHGPRPQRLDVIALREGVDVDAAVERIRHGGWDGIVSSGHRTTQFSDPRLDPGNALAKAYGHTSSSHVHYVPAPLPHSTYIVLNAVSGPLAHRQVRRAIAFAVDRTAIAPIWDSTPTDQLLPPFVGGFRDKDLYPLHSDLAEARALMHGRRLKAVFALTPGDPSLFQEGRLLRAELRRIGIELVLKRFQLDALPQALATGHPRIDLLDSGVTTGSPDGAAFLEGVFVMTGSVPGRWLTPTVRRAVERVNRLSESTRQAAAGDLADRLLVHDVPLVAIGNRVQGELFGPTVGCRDVFPPVPGGVDLAALCRRDP